MYHFGCHDNFVTISTRYVANVTITRILHGKYDTNRTQDKGVIEASL